MGWYDLFSRVYDVSLEADYVAPRVAAAEALRLEPGQVVLDVPCGTGQSFDALLDGLGGTGRVIGIDASSGMLDCARTRVDRHGWTRVSLLHADVRAVDRVALARAAGTAVTVDRLHVFLGLSVFPEWRLVFSRLWDLLRPGGRCVVVDAWADRVGVAGRLQNLVARADVSRRFWEPLEVRAEGFERVRTPAAREMGAELWLAAGDKPPRDDSRRDPP